MKMNRGPGKKHFTLTSHFSRCFQSAGEKSGKWSEKYFFYATDKEKKKKKNLIMFVLENIKSKIFKVCLHNDYR